MGTDNGKPKNILGSLLEGGDSSIKLITLAAIIISGGGNLLTTKQAERSTDHEVKKTLQEIHDIHAALDSNVQRQKRIEALLEDLKDQNAHR
jgi:hypothetical protein